VQTRERQAAKPHIDGRCMIDANCGEETPKQLCQRHKDISSMSEGCIAAFEANDKRRGMESETEITVACRNARREPCDGDHKPGMIDKDILAGGARFVQLDRKL